MIVETGRVVAIETDALWVETIQRSTCSSCAAQKGCGQGLMNKLHDGRRNQLRVLLGDCSPTNFQIDDQVQLAVPEMALLSGSAVVYILPLIAMMAGMLLAGALGAGDKVAAIGALIGLLGGFAMVRIHAAITRNSPRYQARILSAGRGDVLQEQPVLVESEPQSRPQKLQF